MAHASKVWVKGAKSLEKDNIADGESFDYNQEADTVFIRNLMDANVKLTGSVTGQVYTWNGSGDIQEVDHRDKDEILNKKRGRACCGGTAGKSLFEIV